MLSFRSARRLGEISPSSGNVAVNKSYANKHYASATVNSRHPGPNPFADPAKHRLSSSVPGKRLTDLPGETLRDIVDLVDRVDAICLALTSHHLLGIVLAVRRASKLQKICPPRPIVPQGLYLMLPCLGKTPTESLDDNEEVYGEYAFLMSRLWSWVGSTYIYCGGGDKNYIKRESLRHTDGDIKCYCGWSEFYRRLDVANGLLTSHPYQPDKVDRALAASTEARKKVDDQYARIRRKRNQTRAESSFGRRPGRHV